MVTTAERELQLSSAVGLQMRQHRPQESRRLAPCQALAQWELLPLDLRHRILLKVRPMLSPPRTRTVIQHPHQRGNDVAHHGLLLLCLENALLNSFRS